MTRIPGNVTIMIVKDVESAPRSIKMSTWLYRLLQILILLVLAGVIIESVTYFRMLGHSRERTQLLEENAELKEYNAKVVQLEQALVANRAMLRKMTGLVGVELEDPEWGTLAFVDSQAVAMSPGEGWRLPTPDSLGQHRMPSGLPVLGWVSRTFRPDDDNPKTRHFGIDIAVREGSEVLATADGRVAMAGWDSTFGWQVVLDHGQGMQTYYGHNDTLLVESGDDVLYGDCIAHSGNTGLSSAPHLHYEIRKNNKPVNPEDYLSIPE